MSIWLWTALGLTVAVAIYLLVALLRAEDIG
jgi:K+-transporting ATPase KdpF subunit